MSDRESVEPEMRVPDIREEARRQSLAVVESRHAEDDQSFIDAISEFWVG